MSGKPVPVPSPWQAARVVEVHDETARAKTFRLALEHPTAHLAGQHYVVRLTAPDGYRAQRSYSVASAPGVEGVAGTDPPDEIELTVERLADGEVSTFLHDVVVPGDELEVRGPIGGWFVWPGHTPALLVGGGSGIVPLMSMLRLARRLGRTDLVRLVVSVRSPADLYYAHELPGPETTVVYSRQAPPGAPRPAGRLSGDDLPAVGAGRPGSPTPPAAWCSTRASRPTGSGSSASVPPADGPGRRAGLATPARFPPSCPWKP
jgi:ferredoxin-NADP reductase